MNGPMTRWALRTGWLAAMIGLPSCNGGSAGGGGSAAPPAEIAGKWSDAIGDAPWRWIELTRRDGRHGRFVGLGSCDAPPCPPVEQGDYEVDGATLHIHTRRLEGQRYVVKLAGDVMEWRQNDVTIRRFQRVPPTPPPVPRDEYPVRSAARPPGTPCQALTAQGCLLSKECVLEAPDRKRGGPYVCRPAVGPCEGGIAQADPGFADDCKARGPKRSAPQVGGGCSHRPAECFCPNARTSVLPPPGSAEDRWTHLSCACGGGAAQQCLRGK